MCNTSDMHININDLTRKTVDVDISEPHEPLVSIGVEMDSEGNTIVTLTRTDHHRTMRTERLAVVDTAGRVSVAL